MDAYGYVNQVIRDNPDREYNTAQMRKHIRATFKKNYALTTIGKALKQLHDDFIAERIRDGRKAFRYSLADTN